MNGYADHNHQEKMLYSTITGFARANAPIFRHKLSENVGFLIWLAMCAKFKFADGRNELRRPDLLTSGDTLGYVEALCRGSPEQSMYLGFYQASSYFALARLSRAARTTFQNRQCHVSRPGDSWALSGQQVIGIQFPTVASLSSHMLCLYAFSRHELHRKWASRAQRCAHKRAS